MPKGRPHTPQTLARISHGAKRAAHVKRQRWRISAHEMVAIERGENECTPASIRHARMGSELAALLAADSGGWDVLSEARRHLIRNAGRLEMVIGAATSRFAQTEDMELVPKIVSAIGMQRSLIQLLGLSRHAREVDAIREDYSRAIEAQRRSDREAATRPEVQGGPSQDRASQGNSGVPPKEEQ
jgi:hypothetical protein